MGEYYLSVGGSGMTHNRAPAMGSGGPTGEKPSKPSGFWRIWEGLPPLIQALTPLIILLVGGAGGVAISRLGAERKAGMAAILSTRGELCTPVSRETRRGEVTQPVAGCR